MRRRSRRSFITCESIDHWPLLGRCPAPSLNLDRAWLSLTIYCLCDFLSFLSFLPFSFFPFFSFFPSLIPFFLCFLFSFFFCFKMRLSECISVRGTVCQFVHPSVGPYVRYASLKIEQSHSTTLFNNAIQRHSTPFNNAIQQRSPCPRPRAMMIIVSN